MGQLEVTGRLELLAQREHPGDLLARCSSGAWPARSPPPVRTPRPGTARRRSRCPRSRAAPGRPSPSARRGRAGRRPRPPRGRPGRGRGRPRTPAPRRPGRRTPRSGAGRAATGTRRASRPASPTTPRRSSRCPRCRRGGAAGPRPRRRRSRRAPRTSSVAARSAASRTAAGSAPPVRDSKKPPPGVIGRWCGRLLTATGYDPGASTLRRRWSLTGTAVPSCWAHSEMRYSSSIQRAWRSRGPGGRPAGSASTWWR